MAVDDIASTKPITSAVRHGWAQRHRDAGRQKTGEQKLAGPETADHGAQLPKQGRPNLQPDQE